MKHYLLYNYNGKEGIYSDDPHLDGPIEWLVRNKFDPKPLPDGFTEEYVNGFKVKAMKRIGKGTLTDKNFSIIDHNELKRKKLSAVLSNPDITMSASELIGLNILAIKTRDELMSKLSKIDIKYASDNGTSDEINHLLKLLTT